MNFSSRRPASPRTRALGVATIFACIAVVYLSGNDPLTKEQVEESLKHFGDYVATDAAKSGKEGHFTYGAIDIRGFLFNHYAAVKELRLEIKKQSILESVSWAIATPLMTVNRDPLSSRRLYYTFAEPLTIRKNGESAATITFSEPMQYGQLLANPNNTPSLIQNIKLPGSITITPTSAGATGDVLITYDANPTLKITSAQDTAERHAHYELHNIAVTSEKEKPLTAAGFKSELDETPGANGIIDGHYTLVIDDLKTDVTAQPCSAATDITYTGDQPLLKLAGFVAGSAQTTVAIKKLTLDCGEFGLSGEGNLARSPEDPLPSGQMMIKITEVNKLLASQLLNDQTRAILTQVLVKVTGQPIDSLVNVDLPLKREKNGTFYIGDVTFEEIATSIVSNMFIPAPDATQSEPSPEASPDEEEENDDANDKGAALDQDLDARMSAESANDEDILQDILPHPKRVLEEDE